MSGRDAYATRIIRGVFTDTTIRVYQAYNNEIADAALKAQTFVEPWKSTRTTWIKPSMIWMGYRCGWGHKDKNQKRVLAIDMNLEGFYTLVKMASVHEGSSLKADKNPVVVQWDPERLLSESYDASESYTEKQPLTRSIQIGIKPGATDLFQKHIVAITDVTETFNAIYTLMEQKDIDGAKALLADEQKLPVPEDVYELLHMSSEIKKRPSAESSVGGAEAAAEAPVAEVETSTT
eukprot:TRINITY_DN552_c0_g1_i2.p1 TRINITY_DN552_c0_g1~~TRINITY_DN552_c0_g1_i2.p1  ORF type:complete len:248 (+),score=62.67 TRINITY_DN552_c0_g1_i2:40-744(+)